MGKSIVATKQRKKGKSKGEIAFILFCISIPIIQWLIFYVYANASSFIMAFTSAKGGFTLEHFKRFVTEFTLPTSEIRIGLRNTLLTFCITLFSYPFKVLVSYFIYKKVPGAKFYRIVFFLPMILFSICTTMFFKRIVGVNGFIAQWIGEQLELGYVPELLGDSQFANTTVLLNMIWMAFPGDLIIWGGTFARIPEEVLESGMIDGTNWWTEFTQIIVPMVWPTVALQMVLTFCGLFGSTGSVFLLTDGQFGTMTLNCWMYKTLLDGSGSRFNSNVYNYLSAVGLIITVLAIAISLSVRKITDKLFDEVDF